MNFDISGLQPLIWWGGDLFLGFYPRVSDSLQVDSWNFVVDMGDTPWPVFLIWPGLGGTGKRTQDEDGFSGMTVPCAGPEMAY